MRVEPRTDPHSALLRRLRAYFEGHRLVAVLAESHSERWASATFTGARHRFGFRVERVDPDPGPRLEAVKAAIGEAEFAMPGHIVADIGMTVSVDIPHAFLIEALTVEST